MREGGGRHIGAEQVGWRQSQGRKSGGPRHRTGKEVQEKAPELGRVGEEGFKGDGRNPRGEMADEMREIERRGAERS